MKTYLYHDNTPSFGINFYRLRITDKDGAFKYSAIIRLDISSEKGIAIYPNPVSGHIMKLQMTNQPKGNYEIAIYGITSEKIAATQIIHNGPGAMYSIPLRKNIPAGTYFMNITDQQSHKKTFKILIKSEH